jgi:hypothetical protein
MPSTPELDSRPLQTSRPWITVAGCLGGGALTVFVVALIVIVLVVLLLFPDLVDFSGGQRAMRARVLTALGELSEKPALRVATREIAVQVEVAIPTEVKVRPWIIPIGPGYDLTIGQTKATVTSQGNTVQYVVPLRQKEWTVRFDGDDTVVTLPPPVVDDSVVEVQSDPARIEIDIDRDWADHILGDDSARNAALAAIRKAVVEQAASPVAMFEVREKSRKTVADMIRALILDEKYRERRIKVRWTDDPADE